MAVPTAITDLSETAASNSPAGSTSINSEGIDNHLRAAYSFIAELYADKANLAGPTFTDNPTISKASYPTLKITCTGTGGKQWNIFTGTTAETGSSLVFKNQTDALTSIYLDKDATQMAPWTDNAMTCGTGTFRWSTVYAATGTINTSDSRLKTDVADSVLGLDFINALRPVSYKWIVGGNTVASGDVVTPQAGTRTHWGFLAQEVKAAVDVAGVDFGGWVLTDANDATSTQALRYEELIAPLVKAVQELTARVAALEGA